MKWIAAMIMAIIIIAALAGWAMISDSLTDYAWAGVTLDGMMQALQNPVDPALDSATVNAMFEASADMTMFAMLWGPLALGALLVGGVAVVAMRRGGAR